MDELEFWKGKHALVGGGCGFLGSYLVPQLVEAGAVVTVVDNLETGRVEDLGPWIDQVRFIQGDLRDPAVCERVTPACDAVINLAARAFGMEYSRAHNGEMLVHNLLCTLHVLETARRNAVPLFLIVSSSCVYPDDAPVPTPELSPFTGHPESVNAGYGWAKRIQELAGSYYASEHGMRVVVVRPFNPYGGHYRWRSDQTAHVLPALVKRIMQGEDPLVVWGSGQQRRNFMHAGDVTRFILRVLSKARDSRPVNIGLEEDVSLVDLIEVICQAAGKHPAVVFDRNKPEGRPRKSADASRLRELLGEVVPRVGLREGVQEMLEWYHRSFGGNGR